MIVLQEEKACQVGDEEEDDCGEGRSCTGLTVTVNNQELTFCQRDGSEATSLLSLLNSPKPRCDDDDDARGGRRGGRPRSGRRGGQARGGRQG